MLSGRINPSSGYDLRHEQESRPRRHRAGSIQAAEKVATLNPEGDIEDPIGGDVALYQQVAGELRTLIEKRLHERCCCEGHARTVMKIAIASDTGATKPSASFFCRHGENRNNRSFASFAAESSDFVPISLFELGISLRLAS